jgi:hypothetical protein
MFLKKNLQFMENDLINSVTHCHFFARQVSRFAFILSLLFLSSGCISDHVGSSSLAFKEIKNTTREDVLKAIRTVFNQEGYTLVEVLPSGCYRFERDGTQADLIRWSYLGRGSLRMRVDVTVESMPVPETILVRADAYKIKGNWDPEKLTLLARRPYQVMLDHVEELVIESTHETL